MAFTIEPGYAAIEKVLTAIPAKTLRDRDTLITHVLKGFLAMGFSDARYYDVAFNTPAKSSLHILLKWEGSNVLDNMIGYTVPLGDPTVGRERAPRVRIGSYAGAESSGSFRQWMDDLNLRGKSWVDIPLKYGEDLFGLIAVDWPGAPSDIGSDDLVPLDMLGEIIAAHLTVIPSHVVETTREKLNEASRQADSPEELIGAFLDIVCTNLDIAVGAAFRFEWDSDSLTKIQERIHSSIGRKTAEFAESYRIGDYLTGTAWQSEEYRHIPSFQTLQSKEPHRIATASLDRHAALVGEITSLLYEKLGEREQQFLLRFMNRTDNPSLPLLQWHRYVIHRVSHDLSDAVEDLLSAKRLKDLQQAFSEYTREPHKALETVFDALGSEGFSNCAILWHYVGSNYFSEGWHAGPLFKSSKPQFGKPWNEDQFYTKACRAADASIYELSRIEGHQNRDCLIGHLYSQGIRLVLAIPINAVKVKGVLVLPLGTDGTIKHKPSISMLKKSQGEKYSSIRTYAVIIGNIIESTESQLIAEGARQLIGNIGHEVNTPAAILTQLCLYALREARRSLVPDDPRVSMIQESEDRIRDETRLMGRTMDVAMMMATQHQRLQLHFRKANVCDVLDKAAEAVQTRRRFVDASGRERRYRIVPSPACKKLGEVVCDPDLLQIVFQNLLDNAVKYSLPRHANEPIEVSLLGQPQTDMSIVQIKDWGIGIRPEDLERIFRPFYRRELVDTRKAIRGLGIGLYIARRIMVAHEGSVFCCSSTPTLDDPARRALYEGYDVAFEVRIPHTLKEGLIEHSWEGWI